MWRHRGTDMRDLTHLHSSAVGNGLIGVDALAQLLAVEEVLQELLDLGDTGGAAHQDDFVHC